MGGNPQASFFINMAPDATSAGPESGRHASSPLHSNFELEGHARLFPGSGQSCARTFLAAWAPALPQGRYLGEIDMRAIAPTLAEVLGVELPGAEVKAIELAK